MAIEAAHYGETRKALTEDPIVQAMAEGLANVPLTEISHPDGTPRFHFMGAANEEYRNRGGQGGGHLGAVAEVLIAILKERRA